MPGLLIQITCFVLNTSFLIIWNFDNSRRRISNEPALQQTDTGTESLIGFPGWKYCKDVDAFSMLGQDHHMRQGGGGVS